MARRPIYEIKVERYPCGCCGAPVGVKFAFGPDGEYLGIMSDPSMDLIADTVFHSQCWEKFCDEQFDFDVKVK